MKFILGISLILILSLIQSNFAQQQLPGIPEDTWDNVGLTIDKPESYDNVFYVDDYYTSSNQKGLDDTQPILDAIFDAEYSTGNNLIIFSAGNYLINETLTLKDNITIRGQGAENTTIYFYDEDINQNNRCFLIWGTLGSDSTLVQYYDLISEITLVNGSGINIGDYVQITLPNGAWHEKFTEDNNPENYVGIVSKVVYKNENIIKLEDNFNITWQIAQEYGLDNLVEVKKVNRMAKNIGIENIRIQASTRGGDDGTNILFRYAANCWVDQVASINPKRYHIIAERSSHLEIRRCYIRDAQTYLQGGYGVYFHLSTTNSLVEDNIFKHLRHSMIVSSGANNNVFGYNYSCDQYDASGYELGDIQIHGFYPYANLFEGNRIDRIQADLFWGSNGPYNTFIRNYCYYHVIKMEWDDEDLQEEDNRYRFYGNEAEIQAYDGCCTRVLPNYIPSAVFEVYGRNQLINAPKDVSHNPWWMGKDYIYILNEVSFYYDAKPNFLSPSYTTEFFSWPPLGPYTPEVSATTQNIPARWRYCSWGYPCSPNRIPKQNSQDAKTINSSINKFELLQNYPNPFNPRTIIKYQIPAVSFATIKVYDVLGNEIVELVNEEKPIGIYEVEFNAKALPSGIFFYRIQAGSFVETKKMLLMK